MDNPELWVNGRLVAMGQKTALLQKGQIAGFIQTADFTFSAQVGALYLNEEGRLRQLGEGGIPTVVISPDLELRSLQRIPQQGWLILTPASAQRDSFGQEGAVLLLDPVEGKAHSLLSQGHQVVAIKANSAEAFQLHKDGTLTFSTRDSLSGEVNHVHWSAVFGAVSGAEPAAAAMMSSPNAADQTAGIYTFNWDSAATTPGPLTLTVSARDEAGMVGQDSVTVNLARVSLSLTAERKTARAWSIRRDYGYLEITVQAEGITIAAYRLLRQTGAGGFVPLASFTPEQLHDGRLDYQDKYLERRQRYTYRLEALDALGRLLGSSSDVEL